jgi:NDP-sugar pyrophosphorylase family protein
VGDRAKVLADVGGRPFLAHLLDRLGAAGCRRVVLCTGHRGDEVRAAVGERYGEVAIAYSHETVVAGTGGALRLAASRVDDDAVLVLNGDSWCDVDLAAVWARQHAGDAVATMVVTEVADARRFGRVEFDAAGRVTAFREKDGDPRPGWVNAGIYVARRELLLAIDACRPVSLEAEVLPAWIPRGLQAFAARGTFFDIGTPRAYAAAGGELAAGGGAQ